MNFNQMAKVLKKGREKINLSQSDIAVKLGYKSGQFVSNFERGLCHPSVSDIAKLQNIYKLSRREVRNAYMADCLAELNKEMRAK